MTPFPALFMANAQDFFRYNPPSLSIIRYLFIFTGFNHADLRLSLRVVRL
jgi:hypothetical protein